jgi:hypothetical protein
VNGSYFTSDLFWSFAVARWFIVVKYCVAMSFIPEEKGFLGRAMDSVSRAIYPPKDPKEAVQKWTRQIRSEGRAIERNIRGSRLTVFVRECT